MRDLPFLAENPTQRLESIQLNSPLFHLDAADIALASEEVLSKHANVFSDGIGMLKNIKA